MQGKGDPLRTTTQKQKHSVEIIDSLDDDTLHVVVVVDIS